MVGMKRFYIVLLALLAIGMVFLLLMLRNAGKRPVLRNLAIDFGDPASGDFGDLAAGPEYGGKPFLEFGARVDDGFGNYKILPTFEYRVKEGTRVVAPADGVVSMMFYQEETDDYEIVISPSPNSMWFVSVDHVREPAVREGDRIVAGQYLGIAGPWESGTGRVELMVGKNLGGKNIDYCPFDLFDPGTREEYESKVRAFIDAWNSLHPGSYDTPYAPGCVKGSYVEVHGKGVVGE